MVAYHTPLNLLWAGQQAVILFFVLSGFVLVELARRMASRGRWVRSYYVQRLVRLYLPVWGAVLLAVLLALAVPRHTAGLSPWLTIHEDATMRGSLRT